MTTKKIIRKELRFTIEQNIKFETIKLEFKAKNNAQDAKNEQIVIALIDFYKKVTEGKKNQLNLPNL